MADGETEAQRAESPSHGGSGGGTLRPASLPPQLPVTKSPGGLPDRGAEPTLRAAEAGLAWGRELGFSVNLGSPVALGDVCEGCSGSNFRLFLEFLFQDITWQDEHSAPFSWETRVSWVKFRFVCLFRRIALLYAFLSVLMDAGGHDPTARLRVTRPLRGKGGDGVRRWTRAPACPRQQGPLRPRLRPPCSVPCRGFCAGAAVRGTAEFFGVRE